MAAAAAISMKGGAMARLGILTPPSTHARPGLASSFLPPLRLCSSRGPSFPSFCSSAQFSSCRPLHISASAVQASTSPDPPKPAAESSISPDLPKPSAHIWLSDVAPLWQRPYFKNRKWSVTDKGIAIYMVIIHALCLLAPFTFTWQAFGVFLLCYLVTGMLGITLSYHRNLSHKSFTLPKWLEYTFAYCGALAIQGDPIEWVSSHRYHHQHCDTDKDPHSPYEGFWYSHMGWLLDNHSTLERVGARANVADLAKDPFYKFLQKTYHLHPVLSAIGLYAWGGVPFLIWGVAVRAVWVYHITWLVNSASHVWGTQAWNTGDLSRNNWWVAMLAFGEGWHNNHHAFEYSAKHGLEWWQLDPTWYFIYALQKLGLATKVKLPTQEHMNRLALNNT